MGPAMWCHRPGSGMRQRATHLQVTVARIDQNPVVGSYQSSIRFTEENTDFVVKKQSNNNK